MHTRALLFRAATARSFSNLATGKSLLASLVKGGRKRPDEPMYNAQAAQVALLTGVRNEAAGRRAIIFKAARSAMTSGTGNERWTIRFNHTDKWRSPLMGWLAAADTLRQVWTHINVETREDAIRIAERNGWPYEVMEPPNNAVTISKSYAYNFLPEAITEQLKALGPRKARVIFKQAEKNDGHWINRKRSTFGKETWSPNV